MLENFLLRPIVDFFTTDSNRSYKLAFPLLIVFVVSLSLILINLGSPPINAMPWDVIIQLDGAWRVIDGQIPNVDFIAIIPPFTILLTAFGMKVASPSASSIAYGNVLLFIVLTPWAWFIARSRLSAANSFVFAVFMGVLLVAPRALGDKVLATSYAMLYNRQGWVLLSMLCVELFIFHRKTIQPREIRSGLSSGILLALLVFSKLTFFGIGVTAVLIRCFFFRPQIKWFIALASSFLLVVISMQAFLPLNLFSYISEMRSIAPVYGPKRLNRLLPTLINNYEFILIAIVPLLILINELNQTKERSGKLSRTWLLLTVTFIIVSGILLCSTGAQPTDIPLFLIAGLICLEYFRQKFQFSDRSINSTLGVTYLYSILIIIPLLCGTILVKDIGSITYSAMWHQFKLSSVPESQKFQSKTLSDLVIPYLSKFTASTINSDNANVYPHKINDGLNLLRKHISSDSRIFAMDFSNPFPFALELPPPDGGVITWGVNYTFNNKYFPDAEKVFKGANMVMIPKESDSTVIAMKNLYEDYLDKHFIEKENSEFWTLLIKP